MILIWVIFDPLMEECRVQSLVHQRVSGHSHGNDVQTLNVHINNISSISDQYQYLLTISSLFSSFPVYESLEFLCVRIKQLGEYGIQHARIPLVIIRVSVAAVAWQFSDYSCLRESLDHS